jgi:hypothetical protein
MVNQRVIGLEIVMALVLGIQSACAQVVPTSGLYQIVSGRYIACCGIGGPFVTLLPDPNDAFIELRLDGPNRGAQMRFLGQDMETVLLSPSQPCSSQFAYVFTNGIMFADHLRFRKPRDPSAPLEPYWNFGVTNSGGTLTIGGTLATDCPGSADIPLEFEHEKLVAVLMPTATVRVSQVEVCWNTTSNRTYQVQYRSTITTNAWADLGPPIPGNGSTNCITDNVVLGQTQRYYRVLTLP